MKTDNVRIKSLQIGLETGVLLKFDDPTGILSENKYPHFRIPFPNETRSPAESLGWTIIALCWVLDQWYQLSAENEVIRVKHNQGHVSAIGNSVLDRWISQWDRPLPRLVYPFYAGVPELAPPKNKAGKRK